MAACSRWTPSATRPSFCQQIRKKFPLPDSVPSPARGPGVGTGITITLLQLSAADQLRTGHGQSDRTFPGREPPSTACRQAPQFTVTLNQHPRHPHPLPQRFQCADKHRVCRHPSPRTPLMPNFTVVHSGSRQNTQTGTPCSFWVELSLSCGTPTWSVAATGPVSKSAFFQAPSTTPGSN